MVAKNFRFRLFKGMGRGQLYTSEKKTRNEGPPKKKKGKSGLADKTFECGEELSYNEMANFDR